MIDPFPAIETRPCAVAELNRFQGRSPLKIYSGKLPPDTLAPKSREKTMAITAIIISGLSIIHANPRKDCLWRTLRSRAVRFLTRLLYRHNSGNRPRSPWVERYA